MMERCTEAQILERWFFLERWQQEDQMTQMQVINELDRLQASVGFAPEAMTVSFALS
jgi:hypothetical protein